VLLYLNCFSQQCRGSTLLQESHLLMPPQLSWQSSETMQGSIPEWGRKQGRGEGRVCFSARSQHSSIREGTAIWTSMSPKPEPGTLHPVQFLKPNIKQDFPLLLRSTVMSSGCLQLAHANKHLWLNCIIW